MERDLHIPSLSIIYIMLLGFDTFARFPFSTVGDDNSVTINVNGVPLDWTIGNVSITATSIVEIPGPDPIIVKTGQVVISGDANISLNGSPIALGIGQVIVTGDANVVVTGNNVLQITTGSVTITADANVIPTGSPMVITTGVGSAITWSNVDPNANEVWTPIVPY
jgi:hypothetical protein